MPKRTLDTFFQPSQKKLKTSTDHIVSDVPSASDQTTQDSPSKHPTYPIPIVSLPPHLKETLQSSPSTPGKPLTNRPFLNLIYYTPFLPRPSAQALFQHLRGSLPFYRVHYTIHRGTTETQIKTPRYTTVFGVDATSTFTPSPSQNLIDTHTRQPIEPKRYRCSPRPIPACLDSLRLATEAATGESFNFCLVNYYADGNDSISYHSDDEAFLGPQPAIASFSLGGVRDFLMKPKGKTEEKPLKLEMASGDMVLMRAETQAHWLHSVPKRKGQGSQGRINVTFRRVVVRGGTENYYRYNVGSGEVYRWEDGLRRMAAVGN